MPKSTKLVFVFTKFVHFLLYKMVLLLCPNNQTNGLLLPAIVFVSKVVVMQSSTEI